MKELKNSILLLLSVSLIITAIANVRPAYASPTALEVLPTPIIGTDKTPGYIFSVDIYLTGVSGLSAFAFKLAYDPTVLKVNAIANGGFFEEAVGSLPYGPVIEWHNEINNEFGYAWYALGLGLNSIYFETGKTGDGALATVDFEVVGSGGIILDLIDTQLVDPNGVPMEAYEVYPGVFNNLRAAPIAMLEASSLAPEIGETVAFSAAASYSPDGYIVSYYWDFGDGTGEYTVDRWGVPTPHAEHSWTDVGTYVVKLTVTDDIGTQARASITITVTPPRGLRADIIEVLPLYKNIKTGPWPAEEQWWRQDAHFNPLTADVQSLTGGSVTVKVSFTITRDGVTVASFETNAYTFAEGSYLAEHRFDTATDCSQPQFETNWVKGSYIVQATMRYLVGTQWVDGNTRTTKFKVS